MIKRYFKDQSSSIYYQITDRPAFLYDVFIIHNNNGHLSEFVYNEVNEATFKSIMWNNLHIDKEEFYDLQSQLTTVYKNYDRQSAKDSFKKEWTSLLDLKKQASNKTINIINTNSGMDFFTELGNQYNIFGVDQQKQILQGIEAAISNSHSLKDIYDEARAEASMEYCRSQGYKVL